MATTLHAGRKERRAIRPPPEMMHRPQSRWACMYWRSNWLIRVW